jgi:hypothetical protein
MNDKTTAPDPVAIKRTEWLEKVTGLNLKQTEHLAEFEERQAAQAKIDMTLRFERDAIRADLASIKIKVDGKDMKLLSEDGDYMKEIDTWHHAGKMSELPPADLEKIGKQMNKIIALEAELKKSPYYNPGEANFTELPTENPEDFPEPKRSELRKQLAEAVKKRKEEQDEYARKVKECDARIAQDLWVPLQREGVIPENLVPQKYSTVANQFSAASDLYDERLQEYSKALTEKDILKQKFELGFKVGGALLKVATAGADVAGSVAELYGDDGVAGGVETAKEIMGYVEIAMSTTEAFSNAMLTDRDFTSLGDVIAGAVGDILSAKVGKEIGSIVGASLSSAVKAVRLKKLIDAGDYEGAAAALGEAISGALQGLDPSGGSVSQIGEGLGHGLTAIMAGKNIGQRIANGESPASILNAILGEVETMADGVASKGVEKLKEEFDTAAGIKKDEDEGEEEEDEGEDGDEEDETDDGADEAEARKLIAAKFDLGALRAQREAAAKKMAEDMEEMISTEDADFQVALTAGFSMAVTDDDEVNQAESNRIASIEYILAVQAKNEATFNLCKSIATKGAALVTKIFPGAGLVEACLTLTFSIQKAIKQTEEMILWMDNVADAQNAASAQVDAFLNRKGLATKQAAMANVQAALDAAKVVAEVLALTPVAAAAPVVKSSIALAEATIELTDLAYTEIQMANAWKIYQKAREVPMDRYLAREATRENPTLSKYAMAWGAVNGDPIAMEGMRRCGLNAHTLKLPDTNVSKVVAYLEKQYADDPQLLRAVPVKEKWHPGPVELTFKSWMSFYQMATTTAVPLVGKTADISAINAALGSLEKTDKAFSDAVAALFESNKTRTKTEVTENPGEPDQAAVVALQANLMRLGDALGKFKSVDANGAQHKEMAAYIDALAAKAEQRSQAVNKILVDKKWAKVFKADEAA